jgi:hypothetical protein
VAHPPLPDDVQEIPMHPDLYLKIYQQQERELEQRLLQRYAAEQRGSARPHRSKGHRVLHLPIHRRAADHV